MNTEELEKIIRPLPYSKYNTTIRVSNLKWQFECWERDYPTGGYDLNPDFQRGRVWTLDKKIAYLENFIRGYAPKKLIFNCPHYFEDTSTPTDMRGDVVVCVDGLQRITAALEFLEGKFKLFGGKISKEDLNSTKYAMNSLYFDVHIYELCKRKDLLQFYLDLNTGGVVHSESEIQRVKNLLDQPTS